MEWCCALMFVVYGLLCWSRIFYRNRVEEVIRKFYINLIKMLFSY